MKIIYCHNRNYDVDEDTYLYRLKVDPRGGSTVAMEAIQSWYLDTAQVGDFIERRVGIARCSLEDNYCKKTGRDLAKSRMKLKRLTLIKIAEGLDRKTYIYQDSDGHLFEFRKSPDAYCAILIRMLED